MRTEIFFSLRVQGLDSGGGGRFINDARTVVGRGNQIHFLSSFSLSLSCVATAGGCSTNEDIFPSKERRLEDLSGHGGAKHSTGG